MQQIVVDPPRFQHWKAHDDEIYEFMGEHDMRRDFHTTRELHRVSSRPRSWWEGAGEIFTPLASYINALPLFAPSSDGEFAHEPILNGPTGALRMHDGQLPVVTQRLRDGHFMNAPSGQHEIDSRAELERRYDRVASRSHNLF